MFEATIQAGGGGGAYVAVPPDVVAALAGAGLTEVFGKLSYSHQREYLQWIDEAKRPETRAERVAGTVQRLQD
jgi:uncharacterized protein YdeI (YjbR/CyaY-like superfamily)